MLAGIMLVAVTVRSVSWRIQGLHDASSFLDLGSAIARGDWATYFANGRAHQPVYAFLMAPKFALDLDLAAYTFVLHTLIACGTIYLIYSIARHLFGVAAGLLAALLLSTNLMVALWFPWITGDTPFHFFFALFVHAAVRAWERQTAATLIWFAGAALLCGLTRPEGFFVVTAGGSILLFRMLARRVAVLTAIMLILAALAAGAATLIVTLSVSRPIREAFFSNVHVAYPLYVSSRSVANSPEEEYDTYQYDDVIVERAERQPGFVSGNYALAMEGLRFIRDNPLTWTRMYAVRLVAIVFPSVFSPSWSVRNRVYSFTLAFVLVVGSLLACTFAGGRRFEAVGVTLLGLTIAFTVSLFQREMDYRVPVSMHVILSCPAPFGWLEAIRRLRSTR